MSYQLQIVFLNILFIFIHCNKYNLNHYFIRTTLNNNIKHNSYKYLQNNKSILDVIPRLNAPIPFERKTESKDEQLYIYMLKKLSNEFKYNSIEWMIIAGTLVGSLMHHGSIPWDDDMDIAVSKIDVSSSVLQPTTMI